MVSRRRLISPQSRGHGRVGHFWLRKLFRGPRSEAMAMRAHRVARLARHHDFLTARQGLSGSGVRHQVVESHWQRAHV